MTATSTPLNETLAGQRVRITGIDAGQKLTARLCAMGLTPGTPVDVVSVGGGPMILQVLGSRLVLGRGMAKKVRARVIGETPKR